MIHSLWHNIQIKCLQTIGRTLECVYLNVCEKAVHTASKAVSQWEMSGIESDTSDVGWKKANRMEEDIPIVTTKNKRQGENKWDILSVRIGQHSDGASFHEGFKAPSGRGQRGTG